MSGETLNDHRIPNPYPQEIEQQTTEELGQRIRTAIDKLIERIWVELQRE